MPEDFALSEARYHLKAALSHVDTVEQKRLRRESTQRQNEINARFKNMGGVQGTIDLRENLKVIDDLIAAEQKKLDEIVAKRQSKGLPKDPDTSVTDDLMSD